MATMVNHKKRSRNKANHDSTHIQKVIQEIVSTKNKLGERTQRESGHTTSKAYGEAATIIASAQQEAKQIIREAKRQANAEAERIIGAAVEQREKESNAFKKELLREFDVLSRVINEARQKLEQILEVPKDQTGTAEHFSEDTTQMNFDDRMVEAMQPKVQLGLNPASAEAASTKLYSGEVKLDIKSSGDFGQLGRFTERLRRVPNVKLTSLGSCAQGTTMAIIAVAEPIPLTTILKEMPIVEEVIGQDHHVEVALKTT